MKCPNCGFETESAFCQMCGTKISEALHTQNNETTETEYTSPLPQTGFEQAEGFAAQIQNGMPELEINQPPILYIPPAEQPIDKRSKPGNCCRLCDWCGHYCRHCNQCNCGGIGQQQINFRQQLH